MSRPTNEATFIKIKTLHQQLQIAFTNAKSEFEEAFELMEESPILHEYCGPHIETAKRLVENYLSLEIQVVLVAAKSEDGRANYGKFKEATSGMAALTSTRSGTCGDINAVAVLPSPTQAPALNGNAPVPVHADKSPVPSSTITGKIKNHDLQAKARETDTLSLPVFSVTRDDKTENAAGLPSLRNLLANMSDVAAAKPETASASPGPINNDLLTLQVTEAKPVTSAESGKQVSSAANRKPANEMAGLPNEAEGKVESLGVVENGSFSPAESFIDDGANLFRRVHRKYRGIEQRLETTYKAAI